MENDRRSEDEIRSEREERQEDDILCEAVPGGILLTGNAGGGKLFMRAEETGRDFMGKVNASFYALLHGYVVVSPGVRGREMKDENGKFIGMAPAMLCDLKAAVRYLRHNADWIPGDAEKIISNGTSAGGAASSLLGATGNHPDYEPCLEEMGAAKERDNIFAASCYCPITNLDHADMAYEWELPGSWITTGQGSSRRLRERVLLGSRRSTVR